MTLYNVRTADGSYRITKFDDDLNPESSYLVSEDACECPAGSRSSCRHRQMLPLFIRKDAVDQPVFYHHEEGVWLNSGTEGQGLNEDLIQKDPLEADAAEPDYEAINREIEADHISVEIEKATLAVSKDGDVAVLGTASKLDRRL